MNKQAVAFRFVFGSDFARTDRIMLLRDAYKFGACKRMQSLQRFALVCISTVILFISIPFLSWLHTFRTARWLVSFCCLLLSPVTGAGNSNYFLIKYKTKHARTARPRQCACWIRKDSCGRRNCQPRGEMRLEQSLIRAACEWLKQFYWFKIRQFFTPLQVLLFLFGSLMCAHCIPLGATLRPGRSTRRTAASLI